MKPTDAERDPAFERLIARGLEGETDVSGRACPDADLLAAWFDRSLSTSEAERVEAHAAGCGSCQRILADLARSEPEVIRAAPVPAPGRPWHWHWRWLVPVTTAVVVIVAVGNRTLRAPQPLTISSRQPVAESVSPAAAAPDTPAQPSPVASADKPAEAARKDRAPLTRFTGTPQSKGSVADATAPGGGSVGDRLQAEAERPAARAAVPPAPSPQAQARTDEMIGFAVSRQAAAKPAEAAMRAEENVAGAPVKSVVMKAESPLMQPPAIASSPDGKVAWRIGVAGRIERSVDGRVSWQQQASGTSTTLAAASAPSGTVCWAVGARGVVVRTVDGTTWKPVAAPTANDLVFVRASSEDAATVRASDGSEYSTSDGGRTWTRISG